jgi:hypothetical protein
MLNKKYLHSIFKYYKKKYNLKSKLVFTKINSTGYKSPNTIYINYSENKFHYKLLDYKYRFQYSNFVEFITFVLLHEIGHNIDYIHNPEKFLKQAQLNDDYNLFDNTPYHKLPLEHNADKFAKKEIKKWIK